MTMGINKVRNSHRRFHLGVQRPGPGPIGHRGWLTTCSDVPEQEREPVGAPGHGQLLMWPWDPEDLCTAPVEFTGLTPGAPEHPLDRRVNDEEGEQDNRRDDHGKVRRCHGKEKLLQPHPSAPRLERAAVPVRWEGSAVAVMPAS